MHKKQRKLSKEISIIIYAKSMYKEIKELGKSSSNQQSQSNNQSILKLK